MSSTFKVLAALLLLFSGEVLGRSQAINIEGDPSAMEFFDAEKLYQQGQPVLAARQWRKVVQNENGTDLLRNIAKKRLDTLSERNVTYSLKFTYQPRLQRKYQDDVFYVSVNGSALPFVVNREVDIYDKFTVFQKLSFPSVLDGRIPGVEMLSLAHTARLQSDNGLKNSFTLTTTFSNPSSRLLTHWSKTLTHATRADQKTTDDKFGITYAGINSRHEMSFTYVRPLQVSKVERLQQEYKMLHLSSKKSVNNTSILMAYDRYIYDDSSKNYYTLSTNISHALIPLMTTVSLKPEVRLDDKARFPFGYGRRDKRVTMSASTKLPNLEVVDSVNVVYTANHSNISIYRFTEVGIYLDFEF